MLVHGESERNDMVEYFGEQLDGFAFTANGWVQSYGSRCVKPPIIFGDVARPAADDRRAGRATPSRSPPAPVKGMLTGPVTILQWSFVRDDQPRAETCRQIALAIRDEVVDLEAAGIRIIQIDEPALREGLPASGPRRAAYLDWAVECLPAGHGGGARRHPDPHPHVLRRVQRHHGRRRRARRRRDLDRDPRSKMDIVHDLADFDYGPTSASGSTTSTRRPCPRSTRSPIHRAGARVLPAGQLWVNPDCGLKTRRHGEVTAAPHQHGGRRPPRPQ